MKSAQVFLLLSGAALFLFGMTLMGNGLKKISGSRLASILFRLSGTPARSVLLGVGVTAVLQSSCAVSVMTVGFVNAGVMRLRQAVGVILGSILGTSVTGWIICLGYIDAAARWGELLSSEALTGIAAIAGILLRMLCRRTSRRYAGDILMGFAILMLGMRCMGEAVRPLAAQPWYSNLLGTMTEPLAGILAGTLFTAILQSASASVGVLQALSVTGVMTFEAALPLLLGAAFGASAPVLLSALGANAEGRRAALIYPLASAAGAAVCAALFYALRPMLSSAVLRQLMDPFSIAAVNTMLRLFMLGFLAPMAGALESAAHRLVPGDIPSTAGEMHCDSRENMV